MSLRSKFQNVKSQSPWVFSFLWLLNILNTFRFEGFQFNSNLRFYSRAFWNSVFSRHRTSRWPKEHVTYVWKKITYSVIFSHLNCWGTVKSVYVDILSAKGRTDRFLKQKWIPDVSIDFRPPLLCSSPGHNYGVSMLSSINFWKTFWRLTRVRKIAKTWDSEKLISY